MLEIIDEERIQEHAATVGAYLERGLTQLIDRHALIGDVRGLSLMVGVETGPRLSQKATTNRRYSAPHGTR